MNEMKQEVMAGAVLCAMGLGPAVHFAQRLVKSRGKMDNEGRKRAR